MTAATTDLVLAVAHHLLVFGLAAILAFEIAVVRADLKPQDIARIARVDLWYGVVAGAILIVGFSRAVYAAKGWAYYSHNLLFWAKISVFAAIGLLSIAPTVSIIGWRRQSAGNPVFAVKPDELRRVQHFLLAEAALFPLLLVFAAGMARGYGLL
jgi:putative membrane protein